jgi:hypothetical protein
MRRCVLTALVLGAIAGPVAAQSLGQAARKEAERRSGARGPAKSYTGEDLKGGAPATAPAEVPAPPPAVRDSAPSEPQETRAVPDASAERARQAARWRGRAEGLRHQIRVLEQEADEADRAANMSALGGPISCSGVVNTEHERNLGEVAKARRTLAQARKALDDLEEEARRAGVPPGWLR